MKYDFDRIIERRDTDSIKWSACPDEAIPMWVADMDFKSADSIIRALHARIDHGIFGYGNPSRALIYALQERMKRLYKWDIAEPEFVFIPGIVSGLNIAFQAFAGPGEGVMTQSPVYFHFLRDPVHHGRVLQKLPLARNGDTYEIDFDRFESSINDQTRMFVLCNPHNPVGRVFTIAELEKIAEICLRSGLVICSDEIHCDLVYEPHRHVPIATLSPEVERNTVTLMAPSKTYNISGLECGYAIIKNPRLRKSWRKTRHGIVPGVNILGHVAALAGLSEGQKWLEQVLLYLRENRDYLTNYIHNEMRSVQICRLEATYLAWLDCTNSGIEGNPAEFFLERSRVQLIDGIEFGDEGKGFVRLNFACPRSRLSQALYRMKESLNKI
jgi:cystathionine beta-lyase